ncbi:uncharacterized protein Z520_10534 [Fonsecaea multimorphosa CBS 102226]|uniref:tRNA (adenine(58)-N(1))-methyltransferase catalytic subunit TRM61 n=1 Tax=Fonsecaea multimorphosa CBS 102226 TaxID=1442371 RepID=A0A0D2KAT1_9EURO|nr:uncharacterized protein Z520_10534 [Fonsecaea multimorphosa CBS 102226]KIX93628.1 hypothetical protein Z520_10534 [Fonsecaea multimorphosa CBS 102226]OAL19743.1 hypothetical protein AYO22_09270 [Fonsecaea multimorphosa]
MVSTFLTPTRLAKEHDLASLHLRRDQSLPVVLSTQVTRTADEGYAEGVVTNTRFGSFPHSTIIGVAWGSQIRASKVDTGSRGRVKQKGKQKQGAKRQTGKDGDGAGKKRKAGEAGLEDGDGRRNPEEEEEEEQEQEEEGEDALQERDRIELGAVTVKEAVAAESGFVHVLPPTPENWTTSLPHRTQVVYTPDYSYILHRIRARPGTRLIEAGSGSGSFTHAAARAVFNGYPDKGQRAAEQEQQQEQQQEGNGAYTKDGEGEGKESHGLGRVFSYEFHRERHDKIKAEMVQHGLDTIVHAMHRDVYKDGFLVYDSEETPSTDKTSPAANAIFLDLPCPWEALPHLTRESPLQSTPSVLDPHSPVHICTFSPCIEQAQKTISALRRYDWIEIEMVEVQHKRIDVRREYTGLQYNGMRGTNAFAADVDEAVSRLREVEQRLKEFHAGKNLDENKKPAKVNGQQQQGEAGKLPFNAGRLVHRTEAEVKTHTSYLVFAVLPRAWSEEDEALAQQKWSKHVKVVSHAPKSQRQLKKEAKLRARGQTQDQNGIKDKLSDINEDAAKDAA